jgi:glycosyltransferase involved in cell wall biosynthesis
MLRFMTLRATVIIPTFQDWKALQACLDCLAAQTVEQSMFEVIIANNNTVADVPGDLRLPPNARVIHVPKPGSYSARNVALQAAQADILFFTDSDCQPDSRWIEVGLAEIARLEPLGRVGGAVELFPEGGRWTGAALYDRVHLLLQERYVKSGWCVTANLVVERKAFDHVGLFDDNLFSNGDREWNKRATDLGCGLVYSPDTLVRHPARSSFAELARKRRRVTGGVHTRQVNGSVPHRRTRSYLKFATYPEVHRTMTYPGLTRWQRLQVVAIVVALGAVTFGEIVRLRYLSGKPARS